MKDLFISRVQGATLLGQSTDPAERSIQVLVHARTKPGATQEWHLKLPLLDALYLLNILEAMSKDANLDHLRRPPEATH